MVRIDLTGQTYGRLTVISYFAQNRLLCRCECGTEKYIRAHNLRKGTTRSCGCLNSETRIAIRLKHGGSGTPEYGTWVNMIRRCTNEAHADWKHYGGRGITVCDRWRYGENGMHGFSCFLADMGKNPGNLVIDRIDNDSGYSPENCRWVKQSENLRNKRTSVKVIFNSQEMILKDALKAANCTSFRASYSRKVKLGMEPQEAFNYILSRLHRQQKLKTQSSLTLSS